MLRVSSNKSGNVVTLCLRGKIVIGETVVLQQVVECQTEASVIALDLASVTVIDAHGLGVLLELRQHAASKGIEFRLMNVTQLVRRVLEITRLNSVFEVTTQPKPSTRMPLGQTFRCENFGLVPNGHCGWDIQRGGQKTRGRTCSAT